MKSKNRRKLLIIGSSFSGSTKSLKHALCENGCEVDVIHEKDSLRHLSTLHRLYYIVAMTLHSLKLNGRDCKIYINKTKTAAMARGAVNALLIDKHKGTDTVIYIQANAIIRTNVNVRHYLYTDHTNMLSKSLPGNSSEKNTPLEWNEVEKNIFSSMTQIFVMGSHVKESLMRHYMQSEEKISITGAGPNVDLDIERDGIEKDHTNKNILFVGVDTARKGLPVLLKAFSEILKTHSSAHLDIAGTEGRSTQSITYHGKTNHTQLKKLFYSATIFCMPSRREPFGIVFIEAMYAKCACIGSDVGAIPEILGSHYAGAIISNDDTQELIKQLLILLNSSTKRCELGQYNYNRAHEMFSWQKVAEKIIAHPA